MESIKSVKRKLALAEQLHNHLRARAHEKKMSSYEEVQRFLGCSFQELGHLLGLVMHECQELKEPFYPALVVGTNGLPSEGFFAKARELGCSVGLSMSDMRNFWIWQLHKLGMHEEMFLTQTSRPAWQRHKSLLELLGYTVEFRPMYPQAPNAAFLQGKQLVEVTFVPGPSQSEEVRDFIAARPQVKKFLERFDPTADSTERIRQLRRELQAIALERLHVFQSLLASDPVGSKLPQGGDDSAEPASGLPS
jgi:hypothetical protein